MPLCLSHRFRSSRGEFEGEFSTTLEKAATVGAISLVATPLMALPGSPAVAASTNDNVAINEVYARPSAAQGQYASEYIELYNLTDQEIDLPGCRFT